MSESDLRSRIKQMLVKNLMLQTTPEEIGDDLPLFGPDRTRSRFDRCARAGSKHGKNFRGRRSQFGSRGQSVTDGQHHPRLHSGKGQRAGASWRKRLKRCDFLHSAGAELIASINSRSRPKLWRCAVRINRGSPQISGSFFGPSASLDDRAHSDYVLRIFLLRSTTAWANNPRRSRITNSRRPNAPEW